MEGICAAKERALWVLGAGFLVQGFVRCFISSSAPPAAHWRLLGFLESVLPVLAKLICGFLSDAVYIAGDHRMPYLRVGGFLQAFSWLLAAALPDTTLYFVPFLTAKIGASMVEVINDAIATEFGESQPGCRIESLIPLFDSLGAFFASVLTMMISEPSPNSLRVTSIILALILVPFLFTITSISESSLNLPKRRRYRRISQPSTQFIVSGTSNAARTKDPSQVVFLLDQVISSLTRLDIFYSIFWFSASSAAVPFLMGNVAEYLTNDLKMDGRVIGLSNVFGHLSTLAWSAFYRKWMKGVQEKRVLIALQRTVALLVFSNMLLGNGSCKKIGGVSDEVCVAVLHGMLLGSIQLKEIPFSVVIGNLCPGGSEGGLMAYVATGKVLGNMTGYYFDLIVGGGGRGGYIGFRNVIILHVVWTLLPLRFTSWIYDAEEKQKEEEMMKED